MVYLRVLTICIVIIIVVVVVIRVFHPSLNVKESKYLDQCVTTVRNRRYQIESHVSVVSHGCATEINVQR